MPVLPLGDAEIRHALKDYLGAAHKSDPDLFLVEELGICEHLQLLVTRGLLGLL
jgi:hypothetical protein